MATAAVARPSQPLRRTRDAPRPSLGKRNTVMEGTPTQANKRRKLDEPHVWDSAYMLQKHKGKPPSLTIHLHATNFKFEGQDGSFAYDSEMKFVLDHLRRQTVPHQMMLELLDNNVPWYDGCLIVEIHNHKFAGATDNARSESAQNGGKDKFNMHRYTAYITPSPYEAYPEQAAHGDKTPVKEGTSNEDTSAPERQKEKEGPHIFTVVLHPTELSLHHEMLILAETPADHIRNKKRGSDTTTPSGAQPPTPCHAAPPTPISQTPRGQSQKMCLEKSDMYSFQADMLIATNPPLFLNPVDSPQDAERVLEMLAHPLHQEKPPEAKARKRTTAEVAADDALQQETQRRMLIMDERIKPSGTGASANENQGAATSLTFSRFKTIDMVKQKLEEAERLKKEEDFRLAAEKRALEEQQQQARETMEANRRRQMAIMAQQQPNQQQALLMNQRIRAQQLAISQAQPQMNPNHGHPQPNGMISNQQQANQAQMTQSSPIIRQQTPMTNSSPMVQQGGFPMVQTSSQGAGSPPRPTSAALQQHPMARQVSQQQQQGSRNATPHLQQGTPSMSQAMPNRISQTPRVQPGSPATGMHQGTPTPGGMPMQTLQMGAGQQFTPEQIAILQQQRAMAGQAGSPVHNMTPEQIQHIQNQQRMHQQHLRQNPMSAQANPQMAAQLQRHQQMQRLRLQQSMQAQAQQNQMHGSPAPGQAGSPGQQMAQGTPQMVQQTPQMNHAHPQQHAGNMPDLSQLTPQQRHAMAQARARANDMAQTRHVHQQAASAQNGQMPQNPQAAQLQAQQVAQRQQIQLALQNLANQYGGLQNVPSNVIAAQPPPVRIQFMNHMKNAQLRAQQQQQLANGGGAVNGRPEEVPAQPANPVYMQQLRQNQALLAQAQQMQNQQAQQQQQGAGGMNGMTGLSFHMNGVNGPGNFGGAGGGGAQGQGHDLAPQFAAMQNALTRANPGQGGGGQ